MNIAKNLVRARKRKKLSPAQLAKLMGTTRSVIHAWEHGTGPRFETLPKLAGVLDTSVQDLLGLAAA